MVSMEMELSCRGLGILVIATLELAVQRTNPSGYCQGTCRRSARRGRAPVTMHKIHFQRAQASQVKRLFVSRSFASVAIVVSLVLVEECIQAGAGPPRRRRDKAGIVSRVRRSDCVAFRFLAPLVCIRLGWGCSLSVDWASDGKKPSCAGKSCMPVLLVCLPEPQNRPASVSRLGPGSLGSALTFSSGM